MKINCIILARYGSFRVPKKNLRPFKNKPLIYWTLKQSLRIKRITSVILSSDSKEILDIAKKISKKIIINKRPSRISGKKTRSETVIKYLHKIYNFDLNDYILILQPTSPLRKDSDINNTISIALKYDLKCLHSGNYYEKKIKIKKKIILYNNKKKKIFYNKKNYSYNGAIYFFKLSYFVKNKTIYEKLPNIFKMNNKNSLDIDTFEDLKILNSS